MSRYDDREICQFYSKIGACRHGDKCSRKHIKPVRSRTIVAYGLWNNPKFLSRLENDGNATGEETQYVETEEDRAMFDKVYADVFIESLKHGAVEEMVVCENTNPHLSGNVYLRFRDLNAAVKAKEDFEQRYFDKRPVFVEFCSIRSFEQSVCKSFRNGDCDRGGLCNFMHVKNPSPQLVEDLYKTQAKFI